MQASNPAQQRPTAHTPAAHTAAVNGIHMHSHFINTKIRPTCQTDIRLKISKKRFTGPLAVCSHVAHCRRMVQGTSEVFRDRVAQDSQCEGPEAGACLECCLAEEN